MATDSTQVTSSPVIGRQISVSQYDNNVYLLTVAATGFQVLIDAADEAAAILRLVEQGSADTALPARLAAIITTHAHPDHIQALAEVVARTGAETIAGRADQAAIETAIGVTIDRPVADGDVIAFPGLSLDVIGLRGHTPGSIAVVLRLPDQPVHLFTGDSLFPGGVGNTDHDPVRFQQLLDDVTERLFDRFDDTAVVHPGHGRPTTLGAERPDLGLWRQRGW
ncbi:MAG: MBL fold metallo-hydrolase [Propionibacteriaceae bacterium]|jgi:glyoxylase-like metal-dependent hydrolase (beta-lactamase superfamily II)|nr:MBL fold metallo-hydrolase [Propionibacteriaceae bacterium]